MSQVLARVTTGQNEMPRGPDVLHRVAVSRSWLANGDEIELVLPRNLACAACEGGGCDVCGRSGAISLRGRRDPIECLRLRLPQRSADEGAADAQVLIRVPERGGAAPAGSPLPRGLLLLRISPAETSDRSVRRVGDEPTSEQLRLETESLSLPVSGTELIASARRAPASPPPILTVEQQPEPPRPVARPRSGWLLWALWGAAVLAVTYLFLRR